MAGALAAIRGPLAGDRAAGSVMMPGTVPGMTRRAVAVLLQMPIAAESGDAKSKPLIRKV